MDDNFETTHIASFLKNSVRIIKKGVWSCLIIFKKDFQFCLGIFNTVNAMREFGYVMEYSRLSKKEF